MTRTEIAKRIQHTALLRGNFILRSGAPSDTYFDKYLFESDPVLLRTICDALAQLLPSDTEILLGMDLGGIPVATVLSQVTGLPVAFIRKERKAHGTCKFAEGPVLQALRTVIIEDVVSSGGAILDSLAMLRSEGVSPAVSLCVIDRESGGVAALKADGVELRPLFTISEIQGAV